ncbi:MAG: hypothetical protein A2048_02600 [Deltaproteobacteria bacterium GWA2_45_12]|nr:MAG: hypothetical protein A2048_02600 [Deltaproteobacteria bacterium GWA2_45_12]
MKSYFLKVFVSVGIVVFLANRIGWGDLALVWKSVRVGSLVAAVLASFFFYFFSSLILKIIFSAHGLKLNIRSIFLINVRSMFYSLLVPGDLASVTSRFHHFNKKIRFSSNQSVAPQIMSSMLCDRLFNLGALMLWFMPLLIVAPLQGVGSGYQKVGALVGILFFIFLILALKLPLPIFLSIIPRSFTRVRHFFSEAIESFQGMPVSLVMGTVGLYFAYHMLFFWTVDVLLVKSVGWTIPWLELASIIFLVRFIRFIPISIGGIGLREGIYPLLLAGYGLSLEQTVFFGFLGSFLVIVSGLVGGILEAYVWFGEHH